MPGFGRNHLRKSIIAKSPPQKASIPPKPASRPGQSPSAARPTPIQSTRQAVRPVAPPQKVMPAKPAQPARPVVQSRSLPPAKPVAPTRPGERQEAPGQRLLKGFNQHPSFRSVGAVVGGFGVLDTARAHQDISSEVSTLSNAIENLQRRSSFGDIQNEITGLDSSLNALIQLLETVRSKGYCFQPDLDEETYQAVGRWEGMRERLVSTADQQASNFQLRLPALHPQINRLNGALHSPTAAAPLLRTTRTQVDNLVYEVDRIHRSLQEQYSPIETQARELTRRLNDIKKALELLAGACFSLEKNEDLVIAVSTRWDIDGKDDPEGNLFLTNRRLIYERKQKVATKKVLFITTASEMVQEVMINQPITNIGSVKSEGKGLLGHQDFIFVQFNEAKLGNAAFHLRGQSSKMWCDLIERARTNRLDRVSASGLRAADLNRSISNSDLLALQREVNQLQDEMMLQQARQDLAAVENELHTLGRRLATLRSRGYAIEKDLEASIDILATQWDRIKAAADAAIEQQTRLLSEQMRQIQQLTSRVLGESGASDAQMQRSLYLQAKSAMTAAASQSQAAQATVTFMYDRYRIEVEILSAHLDWVGWMLDALATASFQLSATEYGIAAVEAVWEREGLEAENGILYLTGQRLLWEDRVGAYELKVNIPLQAILDCYKDSIEEQEALAFNFGTGAPMARARFITSLPVVNDWLKVVGRARAGGYEQELAIRLDPGELERIHNAPTSCPSCNGAFTMPIIRGQTELVCEYCGIRTRF